MTTSSDMMGTCQWLIHSDGDLSVVNTHSDGDVAVINTHSDGDVPVIATSSDMMGT